MTTKKCKSNNQKYKKIKRIKKIQKYKILFFLVELPSYLKRKDHKETLVSLEKIENSFFHITISILIFQTINSKMFSNTNTTSVIANRNALSLFKDLCVNTNTNTNIDTDIYKNSQIAAFIIGVICVYLIADYVAQVICEKIEARQVKMQTILMQDLNYRDAELHALLKENLKLKEELDLLKAKETNLKKESKEPDDSSNQKIIQCDKCYNEYAAENIQTSYFIQQIRQQYCNECFEKINKQHHIKKSKSDSQFRYHLIN